MKNLIATARNIFVKLEEEEGKKITRPCAEVVLVLIEKNYTVSGSDHHSETVRFVADAEVLHQLAKDLGNYATELEEVHIA